MKTQNSKLKTQNYSLKLKTIKVLRFTLYALRSWQSQAGQVVLMLVLITIVGLTIALSLISRSVTDVRISSQIEQSGRAFSAAEAGIENALKGTAVGQQGLITLPDANAAYSVTAIGGSLAVLSFPLTSPSSSQTVWLTEHNADGTLAETIGNYPASSSLDICWGTDPNITPAIVVSIFYKSGTSYKVVRGAYDQNAASRDNNFGTVDSAGNYCNSNFRFKKTITPQADFGVAVSDKLLFLRITPVYENSTLSIKPTSNLPTQGKVITSVGQTATGVMRKIQVTQGYQVLPSILDFGLFAEN